MTFITVSKGAKKHKESYELGSQKYYTIVLSSKCPEHNVRSTYASMYFVHSFVDTASSAIFVLHTICSMVQWELSYISTRQKYYTLLGQRCGKKVEKVCWSNFEASNHPLDFVLRKELLNQPLLECSAVWCYLPSYLDRVLR